jgi:hypothetical protein
MMLIMLNMSLSLLIWMKLLLVLMSLDMALL